MLTNRLTLGAITIFLCGGSCALALSCEGSGSGPGNGLGGGAGTPATGGTTATTASTTTTTTTGGGACDPGKPSGEEYDPDHGCWVPVPWESPCVVEQAENPQIAAPPLTWAPCDEETPGCEQQFEQPNLQTNAQYQKASVLRHGDGYRIGIRETGIDGSAITAVYDSDGTPLVAWRVKDKSTASCIANAPIVTAERVWFGITAISPDATTQSVYIAPTWEELTTIDHAVIEAPYFFWSWFGSSDLLLGWMADGATYHVEDLATGERTLFGGGFEGNPEYAYPRVVGDVIVSRTAPTGTPGITVWSRQTEAFHDLLLPQPPTRVVDVNTDGQTLAWIQQPDLDVPGQLWTSPLATEPSSFSPTARRPTPPMRSHSSAAGSGFYAVYSFRDKVYETGGPGDGLVHIYRLADAHHWSFPVPKNTIHAMWIYHVDDDYVFYSGHGSLVRQRRDVFGPGDPP